MKSSVLALAAYGAAADQSGEEVLCFGSRAHKLIYEHTGDTFEEVTDATIDVQRASDLDHQCAGNGGGDDDKPFCIGANVDDSCGNGGTLPINDNFECKNCFAGATTDLYYHYEAKMFSLKRVEAGLRNTKIRGALEVHAHKDAAADLTSGSFTVPDHEFSFSFNAGKIPVNLKFSIPTTLEYTLGLEGHLDAVAGADLDIDFGDHNLSWDKDNGFQITNTKPTVTLAPVLNVDTGNSGADIGMTLHSSLQFDANKVVWLHVNLDPAFPSQISVGSDGICLDGDMDFPINVEAEVYHTLFGKDVAIKHFGPEEVEHLQQTGLIHKCIKLGAEVTV